MIGLGWLAGDLAGAVAAGRLVVVRYWIVAVLARRLVLVRHWIVTVAAQCLRSGWCCSKHWMPEQCGHEEA